MIVVLRVWVVGPLQVLFCTNVHAGSATHRLTTVQAAEREGLATLEAPMEEADELPLSDTAEPEPSTPPSTSPASDAPTAGSGATPDAVQHAAAQVGRQTGQPAQQLFLCLLLTAGLSIQQGMCWA